MQYCCSVCKETISEGVYRFSMDKFGKALCLAHQKKVPSQELFCSLCKVRIGEPVFDYSLKHFGKALCMSHQKTTSQGEKRGSIITPKKTTGYYCYVCKQTITYA